MGFWGTFSVARCDHALMDLDPLKSSAEDAVAAPRPGRLAGRADPPGPAGVGFTKPARRLGTPAGPGYGMHGPPGAGRGGVRQRWRSADRLQPAGGPVGRLADAGPHHPAHRFHRLATGA